MSEFKQYRRKQIAELREWTRGDDLTRVSVSASDREAGSPKPGDMIARNPKNHDDQWLVAAKYFADNFEPIPSATTLHGADFKEPGPVMNGKVSCKARIGSAADPQDCDWPMCGCDPDADKVIAALEEGELLAAPDSRRSVAEIRAEIAQIDSEDARTENYNAVNRKERITIHDARLAALRWVLNEEPPK